MAKAATIPSDVDLAEVFRSRHLKGLHGFKPIAQTQDHTCGAAAVAASIVYLGGSSNEGQCAQSMGTNRAVGTTPERMVDYLRGRGFKARGYTGLPFSVLVTRASEGRVTLVDWNDYGGHWVVVAGVEPIMGVIILADPARPRSNFAAHTYEQFKRHWVCDGFGRERKLLQLGVLLDPWSVRYKQSITGTRDRDKQGPCSIREWSKDHRVPVA